MKKIIRWVLISNLFFILSSCKKEEVVIVPKDCSSEISVALEKTKSQKQRKNRNNKINKSKELKKNKKSDLLTSEGTISKNHLSKSKFKILNLSETQLQSINDAATLLNKTKLESSNQHDELQLLLAEAMRTNDLESIKNVLTEKNALASIQNSKELEYSVLAYSLLTDEQRLVLADNSRLLDSFVGENNRTMKNRGAKNGGNWNKKNKRGKRNKNKEAGSETKPKD